MILVACEESQAVTIAFRELGFEAYSCDTEPCSGGHPEWHFQQDVIPLLREKWEMIIAFPPCTHLASSGARYWKEKQKDGRQQQGIDFFMEFVNCKCDRVAIENPVGIMSRVYRKPDQIIQPYEYGDPFTKKTCLWLNRLPCLEPSKIIEPKYRWTSSSARGGLRKDGVRPKSKLPIFKAFNSSQERSKTFPGIARAMATQWGKLL